MSIVEKAKILAKLAELKNANNTDDIIRWFDNNNWVYVMIKQLLTGMSEKHGIISCNKLVEGDSVIFVLNVVDSDYVYNGVKSTIAGNTAFISKLSAKFSVDKIDSNTVNIKVYIIPGKTDAFMRLIDVIEDGVSDHRGE